MSRFQFSVFSFQFSISSLLCFMAALFLPIHEIQAATPEATPRNPQSAIRNREAGGARGKKVGTVTAVEEDEIRFDLGSEDGIAAGMTLRIYRKTILIHPLTKENMGPVQVKIGELEVTEVTARSSLGKIRSQETAIKKGDRVSRLEKEAVESEIRKKAGEDGRKKKERKKIKDEKKKKKNNKKKFFFLGCL